MCMNANLSVGVLASLAAWSSSASAQGIQYRLIARSGAPAPGLSATFENVADARLSSSGAVAFAATLAGEGVTAANDSTVWTDRSGALALVYREGAAAPGTASALLAGIPTVQFNSSDQIGFATALLEPATPYAATNVAYFAENASHALSLVSREPLNTFLLSTHIPLSSTGSIAWSDGVKVSDASGVLFSSATPAPGAPAGYTFRAFGPVSQNSAGTLAFHATTGNTQVDFNLWVHGIYTAQAGILTPIATVGSPVAGDPLGRTWAEVQRHPLITSNGEVIFWAKISGAAGSQAGLFRVVPSQAPAAIVLSGDSIAEVPGAQIASVHRRAAINDSGTVAYLAMFSNDPQNPARSGAGVFVAGRGSAPRLVARRGDDANFLPSGLTLNALGEPQINESGLVAFTAYTSGPGVTGGQALLAWDGRPRCTTVLHTETVFELPGVGPRTVRSVSFDSDTPESGRVQFIGRTIAFKASFTDFSHALLTATLPCPADFNGDGDTGTDADIEAFFACLAGNCCDTCASADFNGDGDFGTDADIEAFFAALGGSC
jgi:hypothetical protein